MYHPTVHGEKLIENMSFKAFLPHHITKTVVKTIVSHQFTQHRQQWKKLNKHNFPQHKRICFERCLALLPMLQQRNTCRTKCFLHLSEGTPTERAHHGAILAFMSMIDDTGMEASFEKSLLQREKWWLCLDSSFLIVSPLRLSVGHAHIALYSRIRPQIPVLHTAYKLNQALVISKVQLSAIISKISWCLQSEM